MEKLYNRMKITFLSVPENEAFVRSTVGAFCLPLNPSLEELSDIKTAVSEAVTNSTVHAYKGKEGDITLEAVLSDNELHLRISDDGVGIEDVSEAMQPFFTTDAENERSGMGFTVMQTFMDSLDVKSVNGKGTQVLMTKKIGR